MTVARRNNVIRLQVMDAKLAALLTACLFFVLNWYKDDMRAFFKYLLRLCKSWKNPTQRHCEKVLWEDIARVGITHTHRSFLGISRAGCSDCNATANHRLYHGKACSLLTIRLVFNNVWDDQRRERKSEKPPELPLERYYMCVDAKVILAYILCTARVDRFSVDMLGRSRRYVMFDKRKDNVTVAHLGPPNRFLHLQLSPDEIDRILDDGWPPFYRESFTTFEGYNLNSTIKRDADVRRPGWIVAVGLALNQPTDLYIVKDTDPSKVSPMKEAVDRFIRVVREKLEPQFRHQEAYKDTLEFLGRLTDGKDPLSLNVREHQQNQKTKPTKASELPADTIEYPPTVADAHLTKDECETMLEVFHNMAITDDQARLLEKRNLRAVLDRAMAGLRAVMEYFKTNRVMLVPEPLVGDQVVYLMDCSESLG